MEQRNAVPFHLFAPPQTRNICSQANNDIIIGPDTRDDESKVSSQDKFFRFVPQENPCQEIYEDASDQTISVSNSSTGEDQQLVSEDWDQEVYETWPQTHPKKGIQVMGDDIPLRDQLQDILHSYPPAKQAFTQSAMYESMYRRYIVPDYCNNKTVMNDTDENGQFEDAD